MAEKAGSGKLNVLHIITEFELGGAQKSALLIVGLLDKTRYNISLASSNGGILTPDALSIPGTNVFLFPTLKRNIDPFQDLLTLARLTKFIKDQRFDIVHTHSSKAGILGRWAAKFAGAPLILHTVHGWGFHRWQNLLERNIFIFLEQITAKITDKIIAVSQSDIKKGIGARIGKADKYTLLRYGIPFRRFSDCRVDIQKKKKELGLKPDTQVVGMVACFKPQKAPQDFVKAASIIKKVFTQTQFLLVGDGVLRKKLERLRKNFELEQDLILTGWRRDIPEVMATMDIFALTSLWEGLPIVLLEAMACGLPIVATATGGVQELVQDGVNGFLVAPGDNQALAQKICTLLKNKSLALKMGQQGRELIDASFSLENMVDKTDNLYQRLARKEGLCLLTS